MKDDITLILLKICNELNEQLKNKIEIDKSGEAVLFGSNGVLDSLGLVNLIVLVESEIEIKYGKSLTLIDGASLPKENSPFRTIETFAAYLTDLLTQQSI